MKLAIKSSEDQLVESLSTNNEDFEKALVYCPKEILMAWVQEIVKDIMKEVKLEELEKNKKKRWFFGKDEEITEEEVKKITDYVDLTFDSKSFTSKRLYIDLYLFF